MFGLHGVTGANEGEEHAQMTIQGEILDMACFVAHGMKGVDHAACALKCVKEGQPMGLLAEDGTVYLLYAGHKDSSAFDKAKDFAGKKVEVTGKQASQGGIKGIEVQGIKAL
jgi:hypothetical protein